ncbi:hypothetical protein SARC_05858 [Sphaeroforma arctica JP610]|uniref:Uncharacterized protein n=1 Tax=Sphaeroforma arctica JP610 TaxID=667725 RepID=A0A0L0G0V5_9EUKA|nr:hypothetical protein SARC_05858 [Sphaeroforma arctica JP610]KNC81838.1 hypothetical protein SARC_05858 [Sphaeroforma arctica JP610]|eukprot:XP_014155740.1 hypothetical protein SARC_05858 [Sphaeroforma arctica JP610]
MTDLPSISNISLSSKNGSITSASQLRAYPDHGVDTRQLLNVCDDNLLKHPHKGHANVNSVASSGINTSGLVISPSPSNIALSSKNGSISSLPQIEIFQDNETSSRQVQLQSGGADSRLTNPEASPNTQIAHILRSQSPAQEYDPHKEVPRIVFDLGSQADLSSGVVTPIQEYRRKTQAELNYGYKERQILILGGWALSFNAGFINAVFLSCQFSHSVAFVSGTVSTSGVAVGNGDWAKFGELFGLWCSYYIGGVISALMIPNRSFKMGFAYGRVLLVVCALLLGSYFAIEYSAKLPAWYQAALALGMQNAITTTFDGAVVRTTHYTGMTTDLAILTAYAMTGRIRKSEYWKFMLFIPQLLSFFCGNIVGVLVYHYQDVQARALFIPGFVSGILGIIYVFNLSQIFNTSFYAMMTHGQEGLLGALAREAGGVTLTSGRDLLMRDIF